MKHERNPVRAALLWLACAAIGAVGAALPVTRAFAQDEGEKPALASAAQPADDTGAGLGAEIDNVGNLHRGIFHFNQDSGDSVQQANVAALAVVATLGAAVADAAASQSSAQEPPQFSGRPSKGAAASAIVTPADDARMTAVANGATGLIAINQSAAAGSNQSNTTAVAGSFGQGGLALASAASAGSGTAGPPVLALPIMASATLDAVGNAASGIVQINQSAAVGTAQTNLVAIAAAPGGIALAEVTAGGDPEGNPSYSARAGAVAITDSFNAASGLVQINQASGGGNAQANLLAAAFGSFADARIVSDTGLGQATAAPADTPPPEGEARTALTGSFEGFSGVAQVSQVSGYGNQTTNTIAASIGTLAGGAP